MKRFPKVPYDSEMKEGDKRLFVGRSTPNSGPSALHVPEKENLDLAICGRVITSITTPKKYGPYCVNCKVKLYDFYDAH